MTTQGIQKLLLSIAVSLLVWSSIVCIRLSSTALKDILLLAVPHGFLVGFTCVLLFGAWRTPLHSRRHGWEAVIIVGLLSVPTAVPFVTATVGHVVFVFCCWGLLLEGMRIQDRKAYWRWAVGAGLITLVIALGYVASSGAPEVF